MDFGNVPSFDASVTATVENLQTSGGYIDFLEVQNPNTVQVFLQLFNRVAANVTLGTTVPTLALVVPPGDGTTGGARTEPFGAHAPHFPTAISYAVTTTATNNTAAASVCQVNFIRH